MVQLTNDEAAYLVMLFRETTMIGGVRARAIQIGLTDKLERAYRAGHITMPEVIAKQF